jgi:hypothetical protein
MSLNVVYRVLLLCTIVACVVVSAAGAQVSPRVQAALHPPAAGHVQILRTADGSTYIGKITEVSGGTVRFKTDVGELDVPVGRIESVNEVPEGRIREGRYWFPNANATRLFFSATGMMLERGRGYFADYWVFFPSVSYGLTDNITIGGGMSIFPGAGLDNQLFMLTPKVGLGVTGKVHLAAGALFIGHKEVDRTVGIAYGVGTVGSRDSNLSIGLGYGFAGSEVADEPIVMVGGQYRTSRRIGLLTENWFIPGADQPLVSFGVRFMGEMISTDLGLITLFGEDTFVPWLDFVFAF